MGLCTLDVIQSVARVPGENEKVTALRQTVAAGGPATNAAVTFAHLGGEAVLWTGIGRHPLTAGIRADLDACGVRVHDLAAAQDGPPAVSSILVTAGTGARAVISTNAGSAHLVPPNDFDLDGVTALQVDGHHPALAEVALRAARRHGIPTVMDAGSWKHGTARLLPLIDVVACSADFRVPGGGPVEEGLDVPWIVITAGGEPIRWWGPGGASGEVAVEQTSVVDTLGAGDVFHGALTHAIATLPGTTLPGTGLPGAPGRMPREGAGPALLTPDNFPALLARAAHTASRACAHFGTRTWMHHTDTWMTGAV